MTKIYLDDFVSPGRRRYGTWQEPDISVEEYDNHMVVSSEIMRIDLIANKWWGRPDLWWVICLVNNISNPFTQISIGDILKIPKIDAISRAFSGVTRE